MLDFWFNLPVPAMFAVLARLTHSSAFVIHVVTFRSSAASRLRNSLDRNCTAPMLAVVGLLFGLLTGFLAADIGDQNAQAARAVGAETNALHEVRTLAAASDMSDIRDALHEFVRSEIHDEWPRMADFRPSLQKQKPHSATLFVPGRRSAHRAGVPATPFTARLSTQYRKSGVARSATARDQH